MKPEAPQKRRFFFAGRRAAVLADVFAGSGGFVFCCRRNQAYCMYKYKKRKEKANENNTAKRKSNRVHRKR